MAFKSDFSAILAAAETSKNGNYAKKEKDPTFWQPTWDEGKTSAVATIRFLPETQEGKLPWAHYYFHNFQRVINGKKRFYNEKCLSTINPDNYELDPVNAYRKAVFESMDKEAAKKVCDGTQRQERYIYNIVVIKNDLKPEDEGKVFKFSCPKSVHDMAMACIKPDPAFTDEDTVVFNPFDLEDGANFKVKMYMKDGFPKWDKCEFARQSSIIKSDKEAEALMAQAHDIYAEVSPDKFGTTEELYKKLTWALGKDKKTEDAGKASDDFEQAKEVPSKSAAVPDKLMEAATKAKAPVDSDDDEDSEYFARLAAM